MTLTYLDFGSPLTKQEQGTLKIEAARVSFFAVQEHPDYELIELRKDENSEILVVDCSNDGVPTRNKVGIKYCERLALRFFTNPETTPEIRALRSDFPITLHQNITHPGESRSLCVYFEPWTAIHRSWTPQKFLERAKWWLINMAAGTLHAEDQPLEPLYIDAGYKLVLPLDFDEKIDNDNFTFIAIPRILEENNFKILEGKFFGNDNVSKIPKQHLPSIVLSLPPIIHGQIEAIPGTLGQLNDQLTNRGVSVEDMLFQNISKKAEDGGLAKSDEEFCFLILKIPLKRSEESEVEKIQQKGFILHKNIGQLGERAGVLYENDGRYWRIQLVGNNAVSEWKNITMEPVDIISLFTREFARRTSGITSEGPAGVLAGVGALGSGLANIWYRQGWGTWTLIDHDVLEPHNLARHSTYENQVGSYKVCAVQGLERGIYPFEKTKGDVVSDKANNLDSEKVTSVLDSAELVIDATTTLDVPRDFSVRDSIARATSVFITPSGFGSVLLIEDSERTLRLDKLEAQYYRALINQDWGKHHLSGHQGRLWVGAGCRDISAIIPSELVLLNSAMLARQIRLKAEQESAGIYVWQCDEQTGNVNAYSVSLENPIIIGHSELNVVWDEGVQQNVRNLRIENLPNETGGILLGYYDFKMSCVFIVDALPAPRDSQGDRTGFSRGTEGLQDAVREAQERTANIVGYLGEWHSHPPGSTANPSSADVYLLANLASELHRDGMPALMLIVGENEEQWIIGKPEN